MTTIRTVTEITWEWAVRCFGKKHCLDKRIRALRLAEEAVELAQACGVDEETMAKLVWNIYKRPPGDAYQELGGVLLTALIFARGQYVQETDDVLATELLRVLAKPPEHFKKRNEEKIQIGLA